MRISIVIGLVQNIAVLLAFAMLYENFWLRNDKDRGILSKIFTGVILGGIGLMLMFTRMEFMPGLVFDTRTVMLAVSGIFFGAIPTIIAMALVSVVRFIMGGDGMWMGVFIILISGSLGIVWGIFRKIQLKNNLLVELLYLGIVVHVAMLGATYLLPAERIYPTLAIIAVPVMLILAPGTILLGLLMEGQQRNMRNKFAIQELYEAESRFNKNLMGKQIQLHNHVKKYSMLARRYKAQNSELKKAKEKAEESDRLKSSFLANLSHEIRTPMNAIMGFADLLEVENLTPSQRNHYIQIIRNSGDYLLDIINDIIEISQIDSGQVELKPVYVSPRHLLNELFNTMEFSIPADRDLVLKLDSLPEEVPTLISTDELKLKQILINLISNAIKFTPQGMVSFGCFMKDASNLTFYVNDTGIGIDADDHKIIFERFRQIENGRLMHGGSGLGLAIVKAYTNMMKGTVELVSEPGKGARFAVTIPVITPTTKNEIKNTETGNYRMESRERFILVAEDEDLNWFLLDQILSPNNFRLMRAVNGREAVDMVREFDDIDLVLMDIKMPEMNGYEALQEIRRFKPKLPVIAQTAYALPSDIERLRKSFSDYITKPINRQLLLKKITAVAGEEN
ncbi:MAG TPA: ATP-binding protein [Mariniphaga sp.]|nr:ATP-binding protein [Mariniphaga sp.]